MSVWLRDEKCRPFTIRRPGFDYVNVMHCTGEIVKHADVPVGEAHVELEVPPGCYTVQGNVCEGGMNSSTDKAIVIVACGQELCVDLIVPTVRSCVLRDIHPFIVAAMAMNVPRVDIATTVRTILAAGNISRTEMAADIQTKIRAIKKEAKDVLNEYAATLEIVKG